MGPPLADRLSAGEVEDYWRQEEIEVAGVEKVGINHYISGSFGILPEA